MKKNMKDIKGLFGLRVRELRKRLNLSQEELAETAKISPKYISRIEMGHQFPSTDNLVKLSEALNVEVKDFFEFDHAIGTVKDLKKTLASIADEADEEKLKLLVKVARAMVR